MQVPLSLSFYTPIRWNWTTICDVGAGAKHTLPDARPLCDYMVNPAVAACNSPRTASCAGALIFVDICINFNAGVVVQHSLRALYGAS